jgi:predicted permease
MKLLRRITGWRRRDDDLREELEAHRDHLRAELEAAGLSARDADVESRQRMGNVTLAREDARDVWIVCWIDAVWRDLRYGARVLRREPGFAAAAILILGTGIATTTTMFSIVDAELWKPLPYPHPERLVALHLQGVGHDSPYEAISGAELEEWRAQATGFEDIAAAGRTVRAVMRRETSEPVRILPVTFNYFTVLGQKFLAGRGFSSADATGSSAVVLTEPAWRRLFDGSPDVIGRSVTLDGRGSPIIGVLAVDDSLGQTPDLYQVIDQTAVAYRDRGTSSFMAAIGRVRPEVTVPAAQAELQAVMSRDESNASRARERKVEVSDLRANYTGFNRRPLFFFLAASIVVLVLTCTNVANLLVARALRRRREFAVRGALGGGSSALRRQLLVEGTLLALPGALAGVVLTGWILRTLTAWMPPDLLIRGTRIPVDLRVGAFALLITALTTVVFGLIPAMLASRADLSASLGSGGRTAGGAPRQVRIKDVLLVTQIALTVMLVCAAGVFLHSFILLTHVPLGFEPAARATVRVSLSGPRYGEDASRRRYADAMVAAAAAVPGVLDADVGSSAPLESGPLIWFVPRDRARPPRGSEFRAIARSAGPAFHRTLGIPIIEGRPFTEADTVGAPAVTIVNEYLARTLFPGRSAIGETLETVPNSRHLWWMARPAVLTIVGVSADVRQVGLNEVGMNEICIPFAQGPVGSFGVVVRTNGQGEVLSAVRMAVARIDPDVPVTSTATMDDRVSEALREDRFNLLLIAVFAAMALLIAAVGIYAVVSYIVSERTREYGVRLALSARPRRIVAAAVGHAARIGAAGGLLGVAGAVALARALGNALYMVPGQHTGLLYGVRATDPAALGTAFLSIVVLSALAAAVPARRAGRVDPMLALRQD